LRLVLAEGPESAHLDELRARREANRARGDVVHRREAARFALLVDKRPADALELARANWDVQREAADARIFMESALAAANHVAAAPVVAWVRSTGIEDPTLRALAEKCEKL
jgi:hypothetical protein